MQSKSLPVLTSGFNRLKPPRPISKSGQLYTGQYQSEWSIENSKGHFCGGLRYLYRFYVLSIEKNKKICFVPAEGTFHGEISISKIVSEYDQEIPQSQTADNPVAPRGRAAQPSRDTRKTN